MRMLLAMTDTSEVAKKLAALRDRAGLSLEMVAKELGYASPTGYLHYESRYKKEYLPQGLVLKLASLFSQYGIPRTEVLALGGIDGSHEKEPLKEDLFNTQVLARILDIMRLQAREVGIELDSTQEAQAISYLYEIAMIDGKVNTPNVEKEAASILKFIKRNQLQ